nr:retrovirus-related Pol polyprotein from transposon TNT 1-94 [Tanacetum cinerariifolium]
MTLEIETLPRNIPRSKPLDQRALRILSIIPCRCHVPITKIGPNKRPHKVSELEELTPIQLISASFKGQSRNGFIGNRVIDSGCSRHMTENMSYLTDYKEIDEGYVAFRGNPKGGKIIGKDDYSRFTWVFFLATKDENSGIHKSFITRIENLVDHKVKMIKDVIMGLSSRIAEAVNTACYVQNKVLVVKPHNKAPYEHFHSRTPTLSFMRPSGCLVTILNTKDHLGKFDGKADKGFFIGYSLISKAFRVFNSRLRIVEENMHVRFSENTPNVVGSGLDWLFDIEALIRKMNYEPIVAGTQSNGLVGTKASDNAGQARKET